MYTIRTTNQFKKDLKRCKKKGLNINISTYLHKKHLYLQ
jgi:mRNA-degrading endonuclease YafQ of YafQ-DinJ toxin-antitoxin module